MFQPTSAFFAVFLVENNKMRWVESYFSKLLDNEGWSDIVKLNRSRSEELDNYS